MVGAAMERLLNPKRLSPFHDHAAFCFAGRVKIDFRTERRDLYAPSAKDFSVVDVPPMRFAMVDGHGDPNISPDYAGAVEGLYSVSFAAKFASKAELGRDYVVGPLEGL